MSEIKYTYPMKNRWEGDQTILRIQKIAKESQREASKKDPKSFLIKRELPKVHAQGRIYISL